MRCERVADVRPVTPCLPPRNAVLAYGQELTIPYDTSAFWWLVSIAPAGMRVDRMTVRCEVGDITRAAWDVCPPGAIPWAVIRREPHRAAVFDGDIWLVDPERRPDP